MNKLFKKTLASLMAVSLLIPSLSPIEDVLAADKSTDISISVEPTTVDITVPLSFACNINPNIDNGFTYANNITVTNNTTCPISLGISSFSDDSNTFENDILPDGLPDGKTWSDLSVSETLKYFALGIKENNNTEWINYNLSSPVYAKTINESTENIFFGDVATNSSVNFDLEASYGKAFKTAKTFSYKLTWIAELYDGSDSSSTVQLYTVDEESTSNLNYELNASSPNYLDAIPNYLDNPEGEEIDKSKIVGTCTVTGLSDATATNVTICDYYEDADGNLYKIVGIKEGSEVDSTGVIVGSNLTNVEVIGKGVSEIPAYAFYGNTSLVNVKISNSVTYIGKYAFADCTSLNTLDISNNNIVFEGEPFIGCTNLSNVILPSSLTNLSNIDFEETAWLTQQRNSAEDGLVIIGTTLFDGTTATGDIVIPEGVTNISAGAFMDSTITSISLPSSVTTIGDSAFLRCKSLTDVVIPDNVITIGDSAFSTCSNLATVTLSNSLTTIPNSILASCSKLKRIEIPSSVTSIGQHAFDYCVNLSTIEIPSSVTTIGDSAFGNTAWLKARQNEVVGSTGLVCVNNILIDGTVSVSENIIIPDNIVSISGYAFKNCSNLVSITIPVSVTDIGSCAFWNCTNFTTVNYKGTEKQWNSINISGGNDILNNTTKNFNYTE